MDPFASRVRLKIARDQNVSSQSEQRQSLIGRCQARCETVRAFQDYYPDDVSHCFGCGRLNEHGLQIKSYWDHVIVLGSVGREGSGGLGPPSPNTM